MPIHPDSTNSVELAYEMYLMYKENPQTSSQISDNRKPVKQSVPNNCQETDFLPWVSISKKLS